MVTDDDDDGGAKPSPAWLRPVVVGGGAAGFAFAVYAEARTLTGTLGDDVGDTRGDTLGDEWRDEALDLVPGAGVGSCRPASASAAVAGLPGSTRDGVTGDTRLDDACDVATDVDGLASRSTLSVTPDGLPTAEEPATPPPPLPPPLLLLPLSPPIVVPRPAAVVVGGDDTSTATGADANSVPPTRKGRGGPPANDPASDSRPFTCRTVPDTVPGAPVAPSAPNRPGFGMPAKGMPPAMDARLAGRDGDAVVDVDGVVAWGRTDLTGSVGDVRAAAATAATVAMVSDSGRLVVGRSCGPDSVRPAGAGDGSADMDGVTDGVDAGEGVDDTAATRTGVDTDVTDGVTATGGVDDTAVAGAGRDAGVDDVAALALAAAVAAVEVAVVVAVAVVPVEAEDPES